MRIVIADTNLLPLRTELEAGFPPGSVTDWPDPRDTVAVEAAVADAEVLVSSRCPGPTAAAAKNLRLVHAAGAGIDGIEVGALAPGTIVANTHHHEDAIAEYAVAAAILLRRGFLGQDKALRRDEWASPVYRPDVPWGDSLAAATVGFVGFGHIGARAWERFRAFGAHGVAVTRSGDVDAAAVGLDWSGAIGDLGTLLETSDVIVVSVPLTAETTGLIGAGELARARAGAVVINVGRGPVVDERALYEALRDKVIAGAAIDVWYGYPGTGARAAPANLPFRELPNLLMTPHSSGLTRQTFAGRAADIAANVRRLAAGEPPAGVVAVAG
ncbi:2-hydroxyacid dehydrogenase [Amycolatopsis sp. YIM 10]|uniref:2-hydroxyacid dehydrogenase n=1 Tax=Amycolatopsis sp. YIM 10 TaxID=2653857 RepID=UPI0012904EA9|nr:2-hydroxyacid dehydrogenase [Amycolatopsis sp. YIM 10]QFU89183.1 Glycerate dehydrogenase [Amycolatopsis sp. YIM 10]